MQMQSTLPTLHQNNQNQKRPYSKPCLIAYGEVNVITQSGSLITIIIL